MCFETFDLKFFDSWPSSLDPVVISVLKSIEVCLEDKTSEGYTSRARTREHPEHLQYTSLRSAEKAMLRLKDPAPYSKLVDLVKAPGFFALLGNNQHFEHVIYTLLRIPATRDVFIEVYTAERDFSITAPELIFTPETAAATWRYSLDSHTAALLWHASEFGRTVFTEADPVGTAGMVAGDEFCERVTRARKFALNIVGTRGLSQEIRDQASFLCPSDAFQSPLDPLTALPELRPGEYSFEAAARYYAASNREKFDQDVLDRGVDPAVVACLLDSWRGNTASLLEAAKTLSAEV